jgi:hypothetical protein
MAIASVDTLTLLNAWQRRMSVPIFHFNQVTGAGVNAPLSEPRSDAWVQPEREYVAEGLTTALALAVPHLGFKPRPVFEQAEINLYRVRYFTGIHLDYGFVQAIGRRAATVIQAGAAVTYSPGGLNTQVLATITVPVAADVTADEIRVYFREADRPAGLADSAEAADDRWWIEPLKVVISGGNATITGHKALFASPAIWADPYLSPNYNASAKNKADTGEAADFVTLVDVYRVYPDATNAVTFLTDPRRGCCGTPVNGWLETAGEAWIEDARIGTIGMRATTCCHRHFDRVRIDYYAGLPTVNFEVRRDLQTALIRLANCELPQEPTAWSDARLQIWQKDTMVATVNDARRPMEKDTPFGNRGGQVAAWRVVSRMALGVGGTH